MNFDLIAFLVFAAITVMSAVAVISARNPVHAALFLVLTFFSTACTWLLVGAEFLGLALVLVYVGAVMVLFLFVVMMLDVDVAPMREGYVRYLPVDVAPMREGYVRYLPVGLIVAVVMLVEIVTLIGVRAKMAPFAADAVDQAGVSNTVWIARRLFTDFLLPFEVAAVILTVAVIAAVMLTLRRRPGTKHQNPSEQARVKAADRVRVVKMDAVRPVVEPMPGEGEGEAK